MLSSQIYLGYTRFVWVIATCNEPFLNHDNTPFVLQSTKLTLNGLTSRLPTDFKKDAASKYARTAR